MPTVGEDGIPRYLNGEPVKPQEPEPCQTCGGSREAEVFDATGPTGAVKPCPDCTPPEPAPDAEAHGQPEPKPGPLSQEVYIRNLVEMAIARNHQQEKGIAKYGTPLTTFNGRDQAKDARQELADAEMYVTALEMERNHLASLLKRALPLLYDLDVNIPEARELAAEIRAIVQQEAKSHDTSN